MVTGYAYLVRSKEEAQKLSYYETTAYTVAEQDNLFGKGYRIKATYERLMGKVVLDI